MKQSFKELMNKYIEVKSIGFKPREYFNKPLPPPSDDPSEGIIRGEDLWKKLMIVVICTQSIVLTGINGETISILRVNY
jgi:hypothetical protein